MKKSLSTILALAMAFSAFSSVALAADPAKTSADFSDLKDLTADQKAKFDAMISAGIFDGVKEGEFGLKEEMNRAQFAKVAALIFGLKVDTSLKSSSFSDVKADDPANGYALPYIEAVKAAGITDGYGDGIYNPAGKVTKEQLATFLIRGLDKDKDAKATPGVNDSTVSDWAKGYVALALQLKIMSNGADGKFGGQTNATRDLLVLSSYEAKQQYKPKFNGKYAIASLKATDANVLKLELNGALTEEAAKDLKIEVKRDGVVLSSGYTTKWDDKKTVATLTFDGKFQNSTYTVTISGVSNLDDANKTASVNTTVEKITKIEFLTASETIPLARDKSDKLLQKVRIDFKATNQYGAQSKLNASNFDIRVNGGTFTTVAGEQAILLTEEEGTERNDRISVNILHEDSGTQASKIFTVGDESLVSKVEIGDLYNAAGTKLDYLEANSAAYLDVKAYDQYGFRVQEKDLLNDDVRINPSDSDMEVGTDDKDAFVDDIIGDDAADVELRSVNNEEKDIVVTVFARGGNSVSKTIKVKASKVPATVEFGSYNYTLAEDDVITNDEDVDAKFYVPLVVKDSKGEVLDADDIVTAFDNGGKNNKFRINSTSGIDLDRNAEIVTTGAHKGQIKIAGVSRKGSQQITVELEDYPNQKAQLSIPVSEARKAESIKFATTPKKYMVRGTDTEMKFKIYDQNGTEMKYDTDVDNDYYVTLTYTGTPAVTSSVYTEEVYLGSKELLATPNNTNYKNYYGNKATVLTTVYGSGATNTKDFNMIRIEDYKDNYDKGIVQDEWKNFFNKSFKFYSTPNAPVGTWTLKATLYKKEVKTSKVSEIDSLSTTIELLDPDKSDNKLTYEAYLDKGVNNTILAADDFADLDIATLYSKYPKLTKEIKVRAKKNGGEDVAVPTDIVSASSSNTKVANIANSKFVGGLEAGTAKVSVIFKNAKGQQETKSIDVTSKNEGPSVTSIALAKAGKNVARSILTGDGKYLWAKELAEKITVKDQYGDEVVSNFSPGEDSEEAKDADQFLIADPNASGSKNINDLLKVTFYVSDITYASGTADKSDAVTVNPNTGKVVYTDNGADARKITGFTVNAQAPSGVTASFGVTIK
ncbi:S-layer homology domain-containing protein [Paenibacillus hamazuiensis]|uniref:S-layer homology domain-containing protein n=1 Tax=Paenibacillus hamazuiensis TaxID=2936508 RepID=UPI00200E6E01|nr:S-layer homology domain-containing protein [Paenibacillus hamazuiensis]